MYIAGSLKSFRTRIQLGSQLNVSVRGVRQSATIVALSRRTAPSTNMNGTQMNWPISESENRDFGKKYMVIDNGFRRCIRPGREGQLIGEAK